MSPVQTGTFDALHAQCLAELYGSETQHSTEGHAVSVLWRHNGDICVIVSTGPASAVAVRISGAETEGNSALCLPAMLGDWA